MFDFCTIEVALKARGGYEVYPEFEVSSKSKDLMIRGSDFYAVWDEETKMWSRSEQTVIDRIDAAIDIRKEELAREGKICTAKYMRKSSSKMIDQWHWFCKKQMRDNWKMLDQKVTFLSEKVKKTDYRSKRLSYDPVEMDIPAYDRLMEVLYEPEEQQKIEYAIGSILCGDSTKIQKFYVFYGSAGTGKSTVLRIIEQLFDGYWNRFDTRSLGSGSSQFALESFKNNPLVSIEHDGDLSKIEDNTKLNSIVSHESMEVNEKFKNKYVTEFGTTLFLGTNKPVRITEAKSGLLRRLVDIRPSGNLLQRGEFERCVAAIPLELGGIAQHCMRVYSSLGPAAYDKYIPTEMFAATNDFYDFIEFCYDDLFRDNSITLSEAWKRYKSYCDYAELQHRMNYRAFRTELRNYFDEYSADTKIDGRHLRNYYFGFKYWRIKPELKPVIPEASVFDDHWWLKLARQHSLLDDLLAECPAQYTSEDGSRPQYKWENCKTKLLDILTDKLHFVKVPLNHIVIDFDIRGEDGEKSLEANLEAASKFPPTYAELSKSGAGLHLHYIYTGDPTELYALYDEHIEVKVFTGNSALRRLVTFCNDIPVANLQPGLLPLKGVKEVIDWEGFHNEKAIRTFIRENLNKAYCPGTKPSIDFIYDGLEKAYADDKFTYDVTDLRKDIIGFALSSTHHSDYCFKKVQEMKFKSRDESFNKEDYEDRQTIVFYDVEVYPNLFLICWKYRGADKCVRLYNPTPEMVEELVKLKLVGFNNRKYDNIMLYYRMMGYNELQLFVVSQRIINGDRDFMIGAAANISYTDVYDFCAKKQSLKKWEIELGMHHKEVPYAWDEPVDPKHWEEIGDYCCNDVFATEAVFDHCYQDFVAREVLASLSGLTVNDTTRMHTTAIIFGNDKHPALECPDLSIEFPGYEYVNGKNMYRGIDVSRGGLVLSKPGMYWNVRLLDVESLHPHSIKAMNLFGEYTQRFVDILDARLAIKHHDLDTARTLLDGALAPYLGTDEEADALAYALKIIINSVYGFTSATFDNPFKDPRNVNNVVALRGALFMKTLTDEVEARGYSVVHVKTDSLKIPDADPEIIQFCMEFAEKYGYHFEHEANYEKMCLVNDAVYIAKYETAEKCESEFGYVSKDNKKHGGEWTATGAQFQQPYVFKTLFSHEDVKFDDMCETKSVTKGSLWLDPDLSHDENGKPNEMGIDIKKCRFVGRVGRFTPVKNGSLLLRYDGEKFAYPPGSKGYRWVESADYKDEEIDIRYYQSQVTDAIDAISQYGDYNSFVD